METDQFADKAGLNLCKSAMSSSRLVMFDMQIGTNVQELTILTVMPFLYVEPERKLS